MLNFLSELQEPPLHFRIFRKPFNVNQNCAMHDDKLHTVPRLELLGNLHQILFQRRDWTFGIASRYGDSENPEDSPFVLLLLLDSFGDSFPTVAVLRALFSGCSRLFRP